MRSQASGTEETVERLDEDRTERGRVDLALLRDPGGRDRDMPGLVAATAHAPWLEERRVGLGQQALGRHEPGDLGAGLLAAPEDEAAEADREAHRQGRLGVVDRTGERVEDGRRAVPEARPPGPLPHARVPQLGDEQVLRVARARGRATVQDQRLADLQRELEMAAEVRDLRVAGREQPVEVETGLADGRDLGQPGELPDLGPRRIVVRGRVVRVDACRGRNAMGAGERESRA